MDLRNLPNETGPPAHRSEARDREAESACACCFDVLAAAAGLIGLSPLFAAIAVTVKLSDGGPVFYRQWRVGRNFRPFRVLKFRTMVQGADSSGACITREDDHRITRVGKLLRRYKFDELPQLWNVVCREMALVGPRPELPEYVERFHGEYNQLLRARPGITDPASLAFSREEELLKGADPESIYATQILPRKLALSLEYLERRTWVGDLKIIFKTLHCVISASPETNGPWRVPLDASSASQAGSNPSPSSSARSAPLLRRSQ
jgi:lipopolysaccharide/colanic/teichoic acid biosynthesis glycosyltransferase